MDVSVINTRIKKNRLIEHSGEYYRGMESKFIEEIQKGKTSKVLLGIEDNSNGTYTALGDQFVFFKTKIVANPNYL